MGKNHIYRDLFFLILLSLSGVAGNSQTVYNTVISGKITDTRTKKPLYFVSIVLENTTAGTVTDIDGNYRIVTTTTAYRLKISYLGYETVYKIISPGKTQIIDAELEPASIQLEEVVVKPKKLSYSNRNNPSVDLIDNVIKNKGRNRQESLDYYYYKKYEKVVFSLSNLNEKFKQTSSFRNYKVIFDNIDTTREDGKDNLPLFIKEIQSEYYYRKDPKATKEIIKAEKTINFDEYIDNRGITANLDYLYQNIDIYDNEIFFLTNKFLSPIAIGAPIWYRYFIQDTSEIDGTKFIKVFFQPRNPADFLFHGFLFITNDSLYAIRKIDMSFNKDINIDWVKDVRIIQNFRPVKENSWILETDEVSIDFGVTEGLPGLLGNRKVSYTDQSINEPLPDSIFKGARVKTESDASGKSQEYWENARTVPLNKYEKGVYLMVDSVKKIPSFKRNMTLIMLLTTEFLELGKFEIGPVGTFYSFNPVEGSRIKFGGRTTPELSKSIYFEGFAAYGFGDNLPKYSITATYALNHKSIYTFPVRSLKINYQYDTRIPGQELQYATSDNFFFSFTRGVNDKLFYNRKFMAEHLYEFQNHFSYTLGYSSTRQAPGGNLYFITDVSGEPEEVPFIDIGEAYLKLRFAPKEQFYQGKLYRDPVPSSHPVIRLNAALGSEYLNNDYNYTKLYFSISKRYYLSIVGYTDVAFEAAKIFGQVSYPILFIHNANQSYAYQRYSYNLMNFLEFVSDRYVSLNIDHSFNGFFFNKVPFLKKLKLREIATFKMLYGGVADKNDPELNPELFNFPADENGIPLTYELSSKPYIEASIGCSNIFRLFRVDLVKRFTYLDNPNVQSWGVRVQFRFDF